MVLLKGSSFGIYALFLEDEEQWIIEFKEALDEEKEEDDLEEWRSLFSRTIVEDNEEVKGIDCSGIAAVTVS